MRSFCNGNTPDLKWHPVIPFHTMLFAIGLPTKLRIRSLLFWHLARGRKGIHHALRKSTNGTFQRIFSQIIIKALLGKGPCTAKPSWVCTAALQFWSFAICPPWGSTLDTSNGQHTRRKGKTRQTRKTKLFPSRLMANCFDNQKRWPCFDSPCLGPLEVNFGSCKVRSGIKPLAYS